MTTTRATRSAGHRSALREVRTALDVIVASPVAQTLFFVLGSTLIAGVVAESARFGELSAEWGAVPVGLVFLVAAVSGVLLFWIGAAGVLRRLIG